VTKCASQADCIKRSSGSAYCQCKPGFSGNPYKACAPNNCKCKKLLLIHSRGTDRELHNNLLGAYHFFDMRDGRPVYYHESGKAFVFFDAQEPSTWVVGGNLHVESGIYLLNYVSTRCPSEIENSWTYFDDDGNEEGQDPGFQLICDNSPERSSPLTRPTSGVSTKPSPYLGNQLTRAMSNC